MQLPLQNFATLVETMAAGVQGASRALLDLTVGSVLRAVLEANASISLWLQWLVLQVLSMTRAATSTGADLDSWMADFALARLPASSATGVVTFSRYTPGLAAVVPAGALVRTADGTQTFAVNADPTNAAWDAAASGYDLAASAASIDLAVTAVVPGSAGNVQPGTVTQLATAIPGIDLVSNAAATGSGLDAESDAALRARFVNYVNSRSRATSLAVSSAVASIQQGLDWAIAENVDTAGNPRAGNFVVTVDDGSGSPPASLLATIAQATEAVRPLGSTFAVMPPAVTEVSVSLVLGASDAASKAALLAPVAAAISAWIDAQPVGAGVPTSRIAALAYAQGSAVVNVSGVTLNGVAADVAVPWNGVVKSAGVVVQ